MLSAPSSAPLPTLLPSPSATTQSRPPVIGACIMPALVRHYPNTTQAALVKRVCGPDIALEKELLQSLAKKLHQGIQKSIHYEPNSKSWDYQCTFTVPCAPTIFRQALWDHIPCGQRLRWPGQRHIKTYLAHLHTLEHFFHLIGIEACSKTFPMGTKAFISPRAVVTEAYVGSSLTKLPHSSYIPELTLAPGDLIGVLGYSMDKKRGLGFKPLATGLEEQCIGHLLGVSGAMRIGFFPLHIIQPHAPITLFYNPKTEILRIGVPYWPFNQFGICTGRLADVEIIESFKQEKRKRKN